jgi:hypothetical protein
MEARLSKSAFIWVVMTSMYKGSKVSRGQGAEGVKI